jgi:signal transduction histidine kinase
MRQSETLSALGQLAAGVAHELKNPIGIIRGFAANALRKSGDAGAVLKALKTISRESERCENIVKKLLSFSRENQKEKTEFELAAAMESALSLVEAQANINGVKIHRARWREFWKSKMRVKGDKSALQQVFINLCGNSMDAMPGGGEITLCVERVRRDGRVFARLTFTDDGLGMSAEVRARIFEPFYTTKPVGKGTGLGLSMVREVVLEHGGAVECESVEGEGTTFTLWLPLVGDEPG